MKNHAFKLRCVRIATILGLLSAISACGGGSANTGSDNAGTSVTANASTVSSVSVGPLMYGKSAIFTVTGTNLDQGVTVSATDCQNPALMAAPPAANTSTTAHYQCTGLGMGGGTFVVTAVGVAAPIFTKVFDVSAPQVTMTLSNHGNGVDGTVVITLAPDKTPKTVDNFLAYVNTGFYDGTVIHAVAVQNGVPYAVQGGGAIPASVSGDPLVLKPTTLDPIALEVNKGLSNTQLTIAMTYNRLIGEKATSQFFINLTDNSKIFDPNAGFLAGYAVFGTVSAGAGTVTSIAVAPCIANPVLGADGCTPTPYVVITQAIQTR